MSTFAVLLLCIQACLVQNVFGYGCGCGGQMGAIAPVHPAIGLGGGLSPCGGAPGYGAFGGALAPAAAYGGAFTHGAAYGGTGEGNVAVAGELPVTGHTAVAGQVPIMGCVTFGGAVPAAGGVSISGKCACGCESPFYY